MSEIALQDSSETGIRARALFDDHRLRIFRQTDQLFAGLMALQWFGAMCIAWASRPGSWITGDRSGYAQLQIISVLLGGAIASYPILLAFLRPGATSTRHAIALAQMLFSCLLIHLSGGRIETHFHIFGSLAFLAFYRDWRVLVTASAVVLIDHLLRGALWPQSVFGVLNATIWRSLEHGSWIVFEDIFLIWACCRQVREMRDIAGHRAELEATNEQIEAKIAERTWELGVARDRCDLALKASDNGLWDWDIPSGRIIVSAHFMEAVGHPAGTIELSYPDFQETVHPDDRAARQEALNAHLERRVPYEFEYRMRTAKGDYRWYRSRGEALRDESGRPIRMAGSICDINDRKRAELAERERRSLEEAVKAMQQVLGVVGHELRTPLAGVRAISELLVEPQNADADQVQHFLKSINEEVVRMSDTIDNLLEAARVGSGVVNWKWSRFDLLGVCEEAIRAIQPLIDVDKVKLVCEASEPSPQMLGDRDAIFRVFLNLLSNAQKHTAEGSIVIQICAEVCECQENWLIIKVRDTGEGIAPQVLGKLGQAFALNSGVIGADHVRGSGLGLAICRGIVAAHGGSITVKSELGHGTTFRVRMRSDLPQPESLREAAIIQEAMP